MSMFDLLKRAAEVVGATALIYGAVAGFIIAFGGHIPPWLTYAEAQSIEQREESLQDNVDLLLLEKLRNEAATAQEKSDANPTDSKAKSDAWFAQKLLEAFFHDHPKLAARMAK